MLKTTQPVIHNPLTGASATIYAHIPRREVDYTTQMNTLYIEEFFVETITKQEEQPDGSVLEKTHHVKHHLLHNGQQYRVYDMSFDQKDGLEQALATQLDGLTGRDRDIAILRYGHLHQNNTDAVYGSQRELCEPPLLGTDENATKVIKEAPTTTDTPTEDTATAE